MTPFYTDDAVTLFHGDCLEVLASLPNCSVDSVVTDPPYGLGFMGREWDDLPPGVEFAAECLRVLKPGGHMLAFGGSRTWHRLTCAIEDAGFEIRDSIAWLYGSGFPKSLDVSKAIDKKRHDHDDWRRVGAWLRTQRESLGMSAKSLCAAIGAYGEVNHGGAVSNWEKGFSCPTWEQWTQLREVLQFGDELDDEVWRLNRRKGTPGEAWQNAEVIGTRERVMSGWSMDGATKFVDREDKAPATPDAQRWQGWGTALKPAFEPIVVARKPLAGTVAANVLEHGTGALNINGTRVGADQWDDVANLCDSCAEPAAANARRSTRETKASTATKPAALTLSERDEHTPLDTNRAATGCSDGISAESTSTSLSTALSGSSTTDPSPKARTSSTTKTTTSSITESRICGSCSAPITTDYITGESQSVGRWPSNVLLDESQAAELDRQSGTTVSNIRPPTGRDTRGIPNTESQMVMRVEDTTERGFVDSGGASRFFPTFRYEPKAPTTERPDADGTRHPTVKPLDLMRWLVRLVTPPGGIVLEPFAGSGTTAEACVVEGFKCVAIEREPDYLPLIVQRLTKPIQVALEFD